MTKRLLPAFILLVAMLAPERQVYPREEGSRCAFIAEVSGKAVLHRGGKYFLLTGMEGTNCGEVVKVLPEARVVVAECGDNQKFEITGPAEFTVARHKPVFKNGRAKTTVKIDPELCPFFLEQAFQKLRLPVVDANGNTPSERMGTEVIYKTNPLYPFKGYVADIKGDVYFAAPEVLKLTGDVVAYEGSQILARADSAFSIYSCGPGKKYLVEGPALVKFNEMDASAPFTFIRGKAPAAQEIDPEECWSKHEAIFESDQENSKPVGLDGR